MAISAQIRRLTGWARLAVVAAATLALTAAILLAAVLAEDAFNGVIAGVLSGSSFLSTGISQTLSADNTVPLAFVVFALVSGMVAAVNPCGFAILPAYLTLYLNDGVEAERRAHVPRQLLRGVVVSGTIGLGFVVLFGSIGSLLALLSATATSFVADAFPWIGFGLGVIMIGLGGYILLGGKLYSALPQRYAGKIGSPQQLSLRGYFLFGISYALASLSCVLPLFLAIIAGSLTSNGLLGVVLTFLAYAAGMTLVVGTLTLLVAAFKTGVTRFMFKILPAVNVVSSILILVVGVYLLLYWLVEGRLVTFLPGASA